MPCTSIVLTSEHVLPTMNAQMIAPKSMTTTETMNSVVFCAVMSP